MDDKAAFFTLFGVASASAVLFAAAWWRARSRLNQLEDRLLATLATPEVGGDVTERLDELGRRVAQLARGQEFVQQLLAGKRHLPHMRSPLDTTPS